MNRSTSLCAKCFVPSCKNTTTNSRNKLFVLVRETLKKKWCLEMDVEYKPSRRLFCCEDHLNLEEDLENYQCWKLVQGRPILKSTAKLRTSKSLPSCSKYETVPDPEIHESPCLKSLLLQPIPIQRTKPATSKHQTISKENNFPVNIRPTVVSASTHPVKIDVAIQCHVKMKDQSTSTIDLNDHHIIHTKQMEK